MSDNQRLMKYLNILVILAFMIVFWCEKPVKDNGDPPEIKGILKQTHPDSVVSNFFYVYDFLENGIGVEDAITCYRDCFVENDQGFQYHFKYWTNYGTVVEYMTFAEEMAVTANMFRTIINDSLYFDMRPYNIVKHEIEVGEDTTRNDPHPGEDWHVYRLAVSFLIDNPQGGLPYGVVGDVEFYVRQCSDGFYRIIRWIDYSHEGVTNQRSTTKAALRMMSGDLIEASWGMIKALYR